MNPDIKRTFFLGANSPAGFYSLYDKYISANPGFFYFIKGGPGCGKSSFMRRIAEKAEKAGLSCEYIVCSADPDSLDGVYFPETATGILDATAPHATEPQIAGITGAYINLGAFYDNSALKNMKEKMQQLQLAYRAEYAETYKLLSAAAKIAPCSLRSIPESLAAVVEKRVKGICSREFKRKSGRTGSAKSLFLDAVTYKGHICLYETLKTYADRICVIDNELGFAPIFLEKLSVCARNYGYDVIDFLSPGDPAKRVHLALPELGLAFASQTSSLPCGLEAYRHIRLDAAAGKDYLKKNKLRHKMYKKAFECVSDDAAAHLKKAKSLHDEMERLYNPNVDFEGVYSLADKYADLIVK